MLQIGIVIDDSVVPKYQAEILRELQKSERCRIALFVRVPKSEAPFAKSMRFMLFRALQKFDRMLFGRSAPFLTPEPVDEAMAARGTVEIAAEVRGSCLHITDQALAEVREAAPDVLLNLTGRCITGAVTTVATYGLWEYRHRGIPPAFWEVVLAEGYSEVTLEQVGSALEPGYLLGRFRTVTHPKSIRKNFEQLMWRSHMMVVRELERVADAGENYFADKARKSYFYDLPQPDEQGGKLCDPQFHFRDDATRRLPTNLPVAGAFARLLGRYLKFTLRRAFKMDRWIILFSENDPDGTVNPDLSTYRRVPLPSDDYFQADPFVVDDGEKSYLFYEELDYSTLKGYLLVAEYDFQAKRFVDPQEILREAYHLSYPNIFQVDGVWYMIPETHENGTVDLYVAESFPTKWKKVRTMLDGVKAVDATLFHKEGIWWMFAGIAEKEGFSLNDELYLYYCDDFRTDTWQPHPQNPVVSDVTCARPAGHLIALDGVLWRPAQNCSGVYGRGLVMNEVVELTTTTYKERVAQQIRADFADDLVAVHTFNRSKRVSVIDAIKSR